MFEDYEEFVREELAAQAKKEAELDLKFGGSCEPCQLCDHWHRPKEVCRAMFIKRSMRLQNEEPF